jgi:hypothetical protein
MKIGNNNDKSRSSSSSSSWCMTRTQSIPTPRAKKEAKHTEKNAATSRSWVPDLRLLILGADLCTSSLISSANFIPNCARRRRKKKPSLVWCLCASVVHFRANQHNGSVWLELDWTLNWTLNWTELLPNPSFRPPSLPPSLPTYLPTCLPTFLPSFEHLSCESKGDPGFIVLWPLLLRAILQTSPTLRPRPSGLWIPFLRSVPTYPLAVGVGALVSVATY